MAQSLIACPLCSAASFSSISALCLSLVNVASKWLRCTMCEEELRGLDKLTIHLLSHLVHTPDFKRFLTNDDTSSGTRLVLNQQPLNLVMGQNEQLKQDVMQKPISDGMDLFPVQTENRIERPSLKIDDEVMIFFNSNENKCFQMKHSEVNVVRSLDREIPSSSGLPKFSINFHKTSDQSESLTHSEQKSITPGGNYFEKDPRNETPQYLFPTEGSINQNVSVPVKDNELQMDVSDGNNKEKELHNSLLDMGSILDTRNATRCTLMHSESENLTSNKSSYLSPKGERVLGFRCDICSLVFPDEHILSMHRQLIHIELHSGLSEPTSYKCHLCSKSFVMKGSLMVHMRVAHFGGAVVARLVEAKQLETDAVSPDSAQFICSICNKGFQKEQQLAQHEKLHDGKQCDVCFKTFTTKYFLRKHKRLHTGEMPYQCSQCNKSFTFQQSYHKHLLYHSDDKPYSCGDCGRAFKELSTLHNHQRIHTGEKPFSCETCGKCFRQRVSYLVHRRIHTGVMPYRCQDCGKTFRYKVSERTHKCSTSTPGGSSEVANTPNTEAKPESLCTFGSKETETQVSSDDIAMTKQASSLEAEQEPIHEMYSGPADFFSLVMSPSPSDQLQHLSLTSDSVEDSRSPTQRESIDSEALKQLLYDVADYT